MSSKKTWVFTVCLVLINCWYQKEEILREKRTIRLNKNLHHDINETTKHRHDVHGFYSAIHEKYVQDRGVISRAALAKGMRRLTCRDKQEMLISVGAESLSLQDDVWYGFEEGPAASATLMSKTKIS